MRLLSSLFLLGASAFAQPLFQFNIQSFPMFGVASGQTARLSAVNLGVQAPALGVLCSAKLAFLDDQGKEIKSAAVTLAPGQGNFVDLDADVDLKLPSNARKQIRAIVQTPPTVPPDGQGAATCSAPATLEIVDKLTNKTTVILTTTQPIPGVGHFGSR
jgi:hypothetical protein